jgi:6,7-dimethyl-8-ribityllumazine synthase
MKEIKGNYSGKGKKVAIVTSQFNEFISQQLLSGCLDTLTKQGVEQSDLVVVRTPGSFEMPQVISRLAKKHKFDALIALGVVIRGETPHFEYIASEVAKGIAQITIKEEVPVIFGVITSDDLEQAIERSGAKAGNKGRDAALTAIEMANIYKQL